MLPSPRFGGFGAWPARPVVERGAIAQGRFRRLHSARWLDGGRWDWYTYRVDLKTRTYVYDLSADCRRRHTHTRWQGRVLSFAVQLEVFVGGQWRAVLRYDTAHGFVHRDLLHADGTVEKTPVGKQSSDEALSFAEEDLRENWRLYRGRFLNEAGRHDD